MSRSALSLSGLLLLCGCGGAPEERPPTPPPAVLAQEEPPAGNFTTHWDILVSRYAPQFAPEESFAHPCYQTDHLRLELLRATAAGLPPPEQPAAEVLIAVEGEGTLDIDGVRVPFGAGKVALLPAGARGRLVGQEKDPLGCLAFRQRGAASLTRGEGSRPLVRDFADLYPTKPALAGVREEWVGGLPGVSLHVLEVAGDPTADPQPVEVEIDGKPQMLQLQAGYVSPYQRRTCDQMLFFLSGTGSLGLSNVGNLVRAGSLVGIPTGVTAYYANGEPREPSLILIVLSPGTASQAPQADVEMQFSGPKKPWLRPVHARPQ